MAIYIIIAIIAYCIGSISFSVLIGRKMAGFDVREKGSKNAGSTNVLRTVGKKAAIITLICDILKGVVAVFLAVITGNIFNNVDTSLLVQLAGLFVVIGHTFPIFFEFRGGKGIATALGVLFVVNYKIALICLVFALLIMALTKIVALGSVAAAVLFPVLIIFINTNYIVNGNYILFGILLALFVIFNHRANIKRLLEGNENKLNFKQN